MILEIDAERGREAAKLLYRAFTTTGIHGRTEMPEDVAPKGVEKGSLEHILFITLTVAIDYQRDANALWAASRKAFEDAETRYLYDPEALHLADYRKVTKDLQKYGVSKKQQKDAHIWRTVGITFYKKWGGDPRNFLADCGWDAPTILARLKSDVHLNFGRMVPDYPYLRGDKIGPLWVRMLRDNVGITNIEGMDRVPIPVDIHIARATLALGVVRGEFQGALTVLFETIRRAWFESVKGLQVDEREMIALDVDEALWHLSKYGCTDRDRISGKCPHFQRCELKDYCMPGRIEINQSQVILETRAKEQ